MKQANELGLYDMTGNVDEWCRDVYEENYARDPEFLLGQPSDVNKDLLRVYRGGSIEDNEYSCRSSFRSSDWTTNDHHFGAIRAIHGFRVALVPVQ